MSKFHLLSKIGGVNMPRFDGTGPFGYEPMTGRGFGPCGRGLAFRRGFGRGFNRGFGWGAYPATEPVTFTKEEQKKILEAELKEIEAEKQEIEKKLKELK
jgi:hypothetical protein